MKAQLFPIGLLLIVAIATAACYGQYEDSDAAATVPVPEPEKLTVCPTFLIYAQQLDADAYEVIPTGSTAQSMQLLADGTAQFAFAGRAPKPQEAPLRHILLGNGYSFLAEREIHIREDEIHNYSFITDLDPEPLREIFGINNIQRVEDIYSALSGLVAITTFKNTDYSRAAPAHFLHENGTRVLLSRTPVLYCAEECPRDLQVVLRGLLSLSHS